MEIVELEGDCLGGCILVENIVRFLGMWGNTNMSVDLC